MRNLSRLTNTYTVAPAISPTGLRFGFEVGVALPDVEVDEIESFDRPAGRVDDDVIGNEDELDELLLNEDELAGPLEDMLFVTDWKTFTLVTSSVQNIEV